MKYFVYYSDDYAELGGEGFECFDTKAEALAFIMERLEMKRGDKALLTDGTYRLIEGRELTLAPVERVTVITAE